MEAIEVIKLRRSVREYNNKPIPNKILESLIDAARFAPTARNVQPWEFVIITKQDTLKKISELAENGRFVSGAAACIAIFSTDTKYYLEDGCAATENILLAATAQGLASCWVAGDKKPYCGQINELLNAPASFKLISLISLGYPNTNAVFHEAEKRNLESMIHWEKF